MKNTTESHLNPSSKQNPPAPENLVEVDELLKDLIPDFMTRRFQEVEQLRQMHSQSDFKVLSQYGHKLKGSSLNYGFLYLGQLAQQLEVAAQNEKKEEIQELIGKIHDHIQNVQIVYVESP